MLAVSGGNRQNQNMSVFRRAVEKIMRGVKIGAKGAIDPLV